MIRVADIRRAIEGMPDDALVYTIPMASEGFYYDSLDIEADIQSIERIDDNGLSIGVLLGEEFDEEGDLDDEEDYEFDYDDEDLDDEDDFDDEDLEDEDLD